MGSPYITPWIRWVCFLSFSFPISFLAADWSRVSSSRPPFWGITPEIVNAVESEVQGALTCALAYPFPVVAISWRACSASLLLLSIKTMCPVCVFSERVLHLYREVIRLWGGIDEDGDR